MTTIDRDEPGPEDRSLRARCRTWWPKVDGTIRGYEPVMLAVAAVLAAALWLPSFGEGETGELAAAPAAPPPAAAPAGEGDAAAPSPAPPDEPALTSPDIAGSPAPAAPPAAAPGPRPAPPDPAPAPSGTPPVQPARPGPEPAPLAVRGAGWASTLGATPLGPVGVPEGSYPVGNRLGQLDAATFVRLEGTGSVLVIEEDLDERNAVLGAPQVAACAITEATWAEEEGQRLDEAPAWDGDRCVDGEVDDLGRWTFDLAGLATDLVGDAGIALVPGAEAPVDFQVSYRFAS